MQQPDRRFVWLVEKTMGEPCPPSAHSKKGPQRACRVLVVDDDVVIRTHLCALLHSSGYEVETAVTGEDALRLLRACPCDIVITDWKMPKMDGLALCEQIRSAQRDAYVYVLMLTVKQSPEDLLAGLAAGADDYIVKGASHEELLARLDKGRRISHWRATHRTNDDAPDGALIDDATGAYSLAYLAQHLPRELARSRRYHHSLSVLTCELLVKAEGDDHKTAAELAKSFFSVANTCLRQADWLVRTAENEFIVVLPETDQRGAQRVARKLRHSFVQQASAAGVRANRSVIDIHARVAAIQSRSNADDAAVVKALIREAQSREERNRRIRQFLTGTGTTHLNDLAAASDTAPGRNWPVH